VLAVFHHALSDLQRTSARTLVTVSDTYDLIRFADKLSGALYPAAGMLEVSPYDLEKGRLNFRHKDERKNSSAGHLP
jgi:hypothetical protein